MIRRFTLRNGGIAGAVIGLVALVVPLLWSSFRRAPVATIDSPAPDAQVPRCFVAKGHVDPSTIRRPLWLIKAEAGGGWREVGRVYPPPGTWASRVCADGGDVTRVRLSLVLADDALDAKLNGPPAQEPEDEIPQWLRGGCGQQGGCGRRHRSYGLPEGATLVASLTVRVPPHIRKDAYVSWFPPVFEASRPRKRHSAGAHRSRAVFSGDANRASLY